MKKDRILYKLFFWLAPQGMIVRKGTSDAGVFRQVF